MATDDKQLDSGNVVPMTRHTSSEPAETVTAEPGEVKPQETRHTSSEPAD